MRFGITEKTMGLIISALMEIEDIERASILKVGEWKTTKEVLMLK